jgi:catechol 2,3-dioxygenase-like lactoylglutathione lyase family enzyme
MGESHLGSTTVAQVAIVVHDIEEMARRWAAVLGMAVPEIIVTRPGLEVAQTYRGEPSDAQCKLAFFKLGQVELELIEPMGGASTWQEALDKRGQSLHHIAFWVDGMQRSVDFLRSQGIEMAQRGDMDGGQFVYMDAEERLGATIELLEETRTSRAA